MEATREIYWNVGSAVLVPMYAFAAIAAGALVYGFYRRLAVYRLGKPKNRTDAPAARLVPFARDALLQTRVIRGGLPGVAHGLFFWSFVLLFIGTTLIFIQADFTDPLFGYRFLKGWFYKAFSLTLDIAGLVAVVMMAGLFVRRYLVRPAGLENKPDDILMHTLLFLVMVTGFIVEGLRMAATEIPDNMGLAMYSPVGLAVGMMFDGAGDDALRRWHAATWWIHFFIAMGFIASIPFSKFRHLFTTPVNYFFEDRGPKGGLVTLDLEDEAAESFGAASVAELSWKDIYDADACTICKRCQDACPAWATGKPLSPMKVVNQIGDTAFAEVEGNLIEIVTRDVLWACVTCRACQEACPAAIEHVGKIVDMRRHLVLMEGEFPGDEVKQAMDSSEVNGNPLGMAPSARGGWAEGLGVKDAGEGADVLYFAGCYASFDKRNIKVARSFVQALAAAGFSVAIMGKDEKCCGEPMRKLGNEYLYQTMAQENIERMKASGAKKIVTTCPHCYNTLSKDYRDLGFDMEVEHQAALLPRLIKEGRLKIRSEKLDITYHDSCYMGRYNDIYDPQRDALREAGCEIAEMDKSRADSFCCGGGGGLALAGESTGERINATRVKMAARTGAGHLVSNCPFCLTMFEDGVKTANLEGEIRPKDLAEIVAERLY